MMRVFTEFFGRETQQPLFHLERRFAFGNAGAICDAEDMRIDGDSRFAEGGIQDYIGR
jgi:hypothetical protein